MPHNIFSPFSNTGHHADVGGIAPGSMPPLSKTLVEEGAAIIAFKLVTSGVFQEKGISELLLAPGLLAGNFGTRNLSDNLSDLKVCNHFLVSILLWTPKSSCLTVTM